MSSFLSEKKSSHQQIKIFAYLRLFVLWFCPSDELGIQSDY